MEEGSLTEDVSGLAHSFENRVMGENHSHRMNRRTAVSLREVVTRCQVTSRLDGCLIVPNADGHPDRPLALSQRAAGHFEVAQILDTPLIWSFPPLTTPRPLLARVGTKIGSEARPKPAGPTTKFSQVLNN